MLENKCIQKSKIFCESHDIKIAFIPLGANLTHIGLKSDIIVFDTNLTKCMPKPATCVLVVTRCVD